MGPGVVDKTQWGHAVYQPIVDRTMSPSPSTTGPPSTPAASKISVTSPWGSSIVHDQGRSTTSLGVQRKSEVRTERKTQLGFDVFYKGRELIDMRLL